MEDLVLGAEGVERIEAELSSRFGYEMEHELKIRDGSRLASKSDTHKPWITKKGKISARVWLDTQGGDRRFTISSASGGFRGRLDWAFIHRQGEEPISRQLPDRKSIWVFLRNASDSCIPCSFTCPGCARGSVRINVSGLSPYAIDSEVVGQSALDCVHSALETSSKLDYAKKGLAWNGYTPREVVSYSGTWSNMAFMDYFHRYAAVLVDFAYPPEQPGDLQKEIGSGPMRRYGDRKTCFPFRPWKSR